MMGTNGWHLAGLAELEAEDDAPVQYVGPLSPAELNHERLKLARDLLELEKAQTRREAAVVVGDSWAFDVLGAQQAGIRSIWLNRGQEPCPDSRLTTELAAFEPLEHTLKALEVT